MVSKFLVVHTHHTKTITKVSPSRNYNNLIILIQSEGERETVGEIEGQICQI